MCVSGIVYICGDRVTIAHLLHARDSHTDRAVAIEQSTRVLDRLPCRVLKYSCQTGSGNLCKQRAKLRSNKKMCPK